MSEETEIDSEEEVVTTSNSSGTLYIMRERDHRTGATFEYFKIGIVNGDKEVEKRERQHRTGNPRSIETVFELQLPAVQKLETLLHNHYAARRVSSGEWFHFSEDEVPRVITGIQHAATKVNRFASITVPSTVDFGASALPASSEHMQLARSYLFVERQSKLVEATRKLVSKTLLDRKDDNGDVMQMLKPREVSASERFNVDNLKKLNNALYLKYKTLTSTKPQFSVVYKDQSIDTEIELWKSRELSPSDGFEAWDVFDLHAEYLRLWALKNKLDFEEKILELELKYATGTSPGITSVTIWENKTTAQFDQVAFQEAHPEIYEACKVKKEATTTFNVAEWVSYVAPRESLPLATEIFE